MKKILLIVATHGNEKIGLEIVKKLECFQKYFDVLVANPEALKVNKRFIDSDLNRSYPGNRYSENYEERRACENFKIAKKYRYIIDIHEASCGDNDFIIIPRDFLGNSFPLEKINLKKVLFWPFPQGPISQFLENSIELEFGMKNCCRPKVVKKATKIIENFILEINKDKKIIKDKKEFFYVFGKQLTKNIKNISKFKDFKKTKINNEESYPLLVGQYADIGIAFYKMRKIINDKN